MPIEGEIYPPILIDSWKTEQLIENNRGTSQLQTRTSILNSNSSGYKSESLVDNKKAEIKHITTEQAITPTYRRDWKQKQQTQKLRWPWGQNKEDNGVNLIELEESMICLFYDCMHNINVSLYSIVGSDVFAFSL